MKIIKLFLLMLPITLVAQTSNIFKTYKLENGLTVVLDKDSQQTQVFGVVAINAGSRDEEPDATGMAHYLEHMLFKGTEELGTADWKSEKPHYDEIIKLYDELQNTKTEEEEKEVYKKINDASQKQSKYVITNEFTKHVQQMGGINLNASTSFDVTRYFNIFPPNQLEKWLDLYAHRFQKPVFRLFQTELETVYEEKNRAEDNPMNGYSQALLKATYGDHPYSRPIIGTTEHLKKPSMSKMITFFKKWYVPSNMVLVLSGNFDIKNAEKLIKTKFGVLEDRPINNKKTASIKEFKGEENVKVKLTPYLRAAKIFNGPKDGFSKEGVTLNIVSELLNNSANTGFLDKLSLDGDVMFAGASFDVLKDGSKFSVHYAPVFDPNQRRQMSFKSAENLIEDKINLIISNEYSDLFLKQVKSNMLMDLDYLMESPIDRAFTFVDYYINGKNSNDFFKLGEIIKSITKDDISLVVKKYLNNNNVSFYSYKGENEKEKVNKPDISPIKPLKHPLSAYANKLNNISADEVPISFVNFARDVKRGVLKDKVNLYYVPNKRNDVFSMNIVFHAGTFNFPKLEYAAQLMNNAGIASQFKSDELKQEFGKLGVSYRFSASKDFTTIFLTGKDKSLADACKLLSKLMIIPSIEDKSLNRILGNVYYSRSEESKKQSPQFNALVEYIKYGSKSKYLDRLSFSELNETRPSELVAELNKAFSYEADVHYYGKLPMDTLANVLLSNLAFVSNRKEGTFPHKRETVSYENNEIFVINNSKVSQSKIFFYVPSNQVSLRKRPLVNAFNQYFSGGFNGVVLKEIREYRSLAYSASASFSLAQLPNWNCSLVGSIGTQADKTNDAVSVFLDILNNMPQYSDRMSSVKDYLINSSYLAKPSDRNLSFRIFNWEIEGYKRDPRFFTVPTYKVLKFENLVKFYNENIKGKPYAIGIVGPLKKIDIKALKNYGKVTVLDQTKLFSKD